MTVANAVLETMILGEKKFLQQSLFQSITGSESAHTLLRSRRVSQGKQSLGCPLDMLQVWLGFMISYCVEMFRRFLIKTQ